MNKPQQPLLICVVGPTAIGKTKAAIHIAQALGCEIISADSRQFYKEMKIGTAVPSPEELAAVPHHFIQQRSIHQAYTVGQFESEATAWLTSYFQSSLHAVLVGGSGLYVDAVVKGLDHFPEATPQIREQLNASWTHHGIGYLQQELKRLDPVYYQRVDRENPHRLIRALEVCLASGKPYSSYLNQPKPARRFRTLHIGLDAPREVVYDRINTRVDLMMQEGLLEEARALFDYKDLNALQTVGYRELFDHFEGRIDLETAVDRIKMNSRRFAKRQGTWFRKNRDIHWVPYDLKAKVLIDQVCQWIEALPPS